MIGKRIQQLRIERNMTLSELARKTSIAKSYLSTLERGTQVNPSIHILRRLSYALNVPLQVLIQEEDSRNGREV